MTDPDDPLDPERVEALRQHVMEALGVFFDLWVVERVCECIVAKVRDGVVGEGILYRDLIRDAGVPSWAAHTGLLGPVLALVSLRSYEDDAVLLGVLTRATNEQLPPTEEFCQVLEQLGLVTSRRRREECLEMWDHHWKRAISHFDSRNQCGSGPKR